MFSTNKKNNVLIVVAHPDDETLGCGGTIARHVENGDNVDVLFLADGETSRSARYNENRVIEREKSGQTACSILGVNEPKFLGYPDNMMDTVALLDIVNEIEMVLEQVKPTVIYTHHSGDLNVDHQIVHQAVMTASRPQPECVVREIYSFEVLSSTEWATPLPQSSFIPNRFVDISSTLKRKLLALKEYEMEMRLFPHSRSVDSVVTLARYRGTTVGVNAAEAFRVERILE